MAQKSSGSFHKYFHDLPVLTSHMERRGNLKKCLYSIRVKNKKLIYIGLTYNFKKRILTHLNSKRFKDIKKLYGESSIETKQLTDYMDREKAGELEDKIIATLSKQWLYFVKSSWRRSYRRRTC